MEEHFLKNVYFVLNARKSRSENRSVLYVHEDLRTALTRQEAKRKLLRSVRRIDQFGGIAQLGERLLCKQEVIGSIPFTSTISFGNGGCDEGLIKEISYFPFEFVNRPKSSDCFIIL